VNIIGVGGRAGIGRAFTPKGSPSDAIEAVMPATNPRRDRSALIRRDTDAMPGRWQRQLWWPVTPASSPDLQESIGHLRAVPDPIGFEGAVSKRQRLRHAFDPTVSLDKIANTEA
jgi:hypothetical protein